MKWIKVEDRLPDLFGTCLVYTKSQDTKVGTFLCLDEWEDDFTNPIYPTHWMLLPPPPTE